MDLNEMRDEAYATSKSKGWYEQGRRDVPTLLALVHSEASEALEAWRATGDEGIIADAKLAAHRLSLSNGHTFKPEDVASELSDVVIRIGDMCGAYEIDLALAVRLAEEEYSPNKRLLYQSDKLFSSLVSFLHADISKAHETWCLYDTMTQIFSTSLGTILLSTKYLAEGRGIDLDVAVKAKMAFNKTRSYRHGGKQV